MWLAPDQLLVTEFLECPCILMIRVFCMPGALNHTVSACLNSLCKQYDGWWRPAFLPGPGAAVTVVSHEGTCAYVTSLQLKPWNPRLERTSLTENTLHVLLQFAVIGLNAPLQLSWEKTLGSSRLYPPKSAQYTIFLHWSCFGSFHCNKTQAGLQSPVSPPSEFPNLGRS